MCSLYRTVRHNSYPTGLECDMSSLRSENREPDRSFLRDTPRPFVRTCVREREREFVSVLRVGLWRSLETVTTLEHYTYDPLKHGIGSDALCPSSHTNAQLSPDAVFEHVVATLSMNSIPVGFEAQLRSHLKP